MKRRTIYTHFSFFFFYNPLNIPIAAPDLHPNEGWSYRERGDRGSCGPPKLPKFNINFLLPLEQKGAFFFKKKVFVPFAYWPPMCIFTNAKALSFSATDTG